MQREIITIHVKMDRQTFRRFALFDTFRLKKRWCKPALFCAILLVFAAVAFAAGREQSLPVKRKKAPRRLEEMTVFLLLHQGRVALRKRPDTGLLAGLWEFPHVPGALDEAGAGAVLAFWGLRPLEWRQKIEAKHIFTHVEWHMTGYLLEVRQAAGDFAWAAGADLEVMAVPSAFGKYLDEVRHTLENAT